MGTFCSIIVAICSSAFGYNKGRFTANGKLVAFLHFKICSFSVSGYIDPDPIIPNPPELLTELASLQPLHQIMPA